ncbi:branched-chain amino acid ABC transporter permease [Nocardioides sp. MAH-18]|uniref:Branched-chain amino acid ABC transporter permease n=1 Tax=Nocardioides agri TaxID=2682843 RepID=A0A6L6XLL8_9ACTN|nr:MULTISPECIES: branched-chain amino acid ABC transporter permease [unclassified Nocardioides]MBA2953205.1 branched-chain amino acid ABC transporter permease [Nocardioides sp. CGMCC 1.13656]MVQ48074.1 branched-chain amino acid ABC transporter permease [Nocardioides sp. MAH-18]
MTTRTIQHGSTEHRIWQVLLYGGIAAVVLAIALTQPDYRMAQFSAVAAWSVALLGMNLIIGYGGQMALGHSAFFGFGSYLTAILYADYGVSFVGTLPISALAGAAIGFLLGLPALRISGLYLALVTLALALAFPAIAKMDQLSALTGGANGKLAYIQWLPPTWLPFTVTSAAWVFLTLSAFAAVLFLLASNAMRSRVGRAVVALRDNQIGAAVSGVHPATWKTSTFAVSAAYASLAGSLMMLAVPIVTPDSGGFLVAVTLITGMVIGGAGTISGAVIGGVAVVWLPELSKHWAGALPLVSESDGTALSTAVYGAVLILVVFVMPGGVVTFVRRLRARFVVVVPQVPATSPPVAHAAPLSPTPELEMERP